MSRQFRTTTWSIKYGGKEVQNPVLRLGLGLLMGVFGVFMSALWFVMVVLLVVFSPLLVALHFGLRAIGRQGFVQRSPGNLKISVDADGFRKRQRY